MSKSTQYSINMFIVVTIQIAFGIMTYIICKGNLSSITIATLVGIYLSALVVKFAVYGRQAKTETN